MKTINIILPVVFALALFSFSACAGSDMPLPGSSDRSAAVTAETDTGVFSSETEEGEEATVTSETPKAAEQDDFEKMVALNTRRMAALDAFRNKYSEDEYGGAYFGDPEIQYPPDLYILLLEDDPGREEKESFLNGIGEGIIIRYCKYSKETLSLEMNKLIDLLMEGKVYCLGLDFANNSIIVDVKVDGITYELLRDEYEIELEEEHVVIRRVPDDSEVIPQVGIPAE